MRWPNLSARSSLVVVGVLVLLLAVLATLQYRWIARLSEAERQRLEAELEEAAAGFCEDFDREVGRVFAAFSLSVAPGETNLAPLLAETLAEWRVSAPYPDLVRDLYVIRWEEDEAMEVLRLDESSLTLLPGDLDPVLEGLRRRLREPGRAAGVFGTLPGVVVAVHELPTRGGPAAGGWQPPRDHVAVRFDLEVVSGELLQKLAHTYFGAGDDIAYAVSVALADRPDRVVFSAGPPPGFPAGRADSTHRLFGLSDSSDEPPARDPAGARRPPPPGRREAGPPPQSGHPERRPPGLSAGPPQLRGPTDPGRWLLSVRHPSGSLEHAVADARWRNLAISVATLLMLGATALLMVGSSRRAQHLARQQMDFVASVSHELRTPLTAIRSAGQNLADGVIDDPERVRDYGLLIEREGQRLTEMIGRVLTFAGIRSGRQSFRMELVAPAEVVTAALDDCSWVLREKGFDLDTELAPGLPRVRGDASALRQAITNLIDNAVKYAAAGRWLGVSVDSGPTPAGGEVRISISDRGPGISRKDLQQVFEPFHRGADAGGSSIPGSGLGLAVVRSIVEAHGGSIDAGSTPGGGATFTVRLPAPSQEGIVGEGG